MGKGHNNNNNNNNSGGGKMKMKMMIMKREMRCSYGLMLLLGFGAAVFGVMILHKFRERRIFDLLIKEKDQQLFSLQLLLQKERENAKETKRKTEEMRARIYSLRTQKMNLDNRILKMRSTISSMRDEQRTMDMALEEKQNEIKLLNKRGIDYTKAEINGMEQQQQHIEQPVKVWSVSADDPSNPRVNSTEAGESKETDAKSVNSMDGIGNESENNSDGEESRQGKDRIENEGEIAVRRAMTGEEQPRKQERTSEESMEHGSTTSEMSIDRYQGENTENSQVGEGSGIGREENSSNGIRGNKSSVEVGKSGDTDSEIDSHLEEPASSVQSVNDKSGVKYRRGGIKLQTSDNHTLRHTNTRKGKGKKLRNIANNRMFENRGKSEEIGVARIGGRGFFKGELEIERITTQQDAEPGRNELQGIDEQVGLDHKEEKSALDGENAKENKLDAKTTDTSTEVKLLKPEVSTATRNMSDGGKRKSNQPVENVQETHVNHITSEKHHNSPDKQQLTRTVDGEGNRTTKDASKDNQVEGGLSDEEASDIHKETKQRDSVEEDKDSKQGKAAEKDEEPEDLEAEDLHESDTDIFRESNSTLEEDKEEYKEEADEPDF